MPWLTPEEFAARQAEETREARDAYTWESASSDLAYASPLTIIEAGRVVEEFKKVGLHPYDALPLLLRIFEGLDPRPVGQSRELAKNIVRLIKLAEETE